MATSPTSARGDAGGPIFGRERELARIGGLVDSLSERGEALLVRGEAGIGKSVLLSAARQRARESDMRVLHATGVESEAELPFAGMHQLLMPLLDGVDLLPAPQRMALMAAFGMVETTDAPDRFMIGLAVLELLSDAAESSPVLVVADDAQWLDPSTAGVLGFVARRLDYEPIGLVLAIRSGEADPFADAGIPEIVLSGLENESADALLSARSHELEAVVRGRLLAEASGNPLALVELPARLSDDELAGRAPLPSALPLTARLERAFAAEAMALPDPTQTLLLLTSADDGEGSLDEILEAARVMSGDRLRAEDLAPAVSARLVQIEGRRVTFRHPLVRSAVHQSATLAERRTAHAALARVLGDQPDRQVWHRAADLVGPDEAVAASLEEAAGRARRRGALSTAIRASERSAEVSEDELRKGARLLRAAELAFETGRHERAGRLLTEAQRYDLSLAGRQRVVFMRQLFREEAILGDAELSGILNAVERLGRDEDQAAATGLLRLAAGHGLVASAGEEVRERIVRLILTYGENDDPSLMCVQAFASPVHRGAEIIRTIAGISTKVGIDAEGKRLVGQAAWAVGAHELAVSFLGASMDDLRAHGRIAMLATAVTSRAHALWGLDRWYQAASDADEGRHLSQETRQPTWETHAMLIQSVLAAVRGESERVGALAKEIERVSLPMGLRLPLTYIRWAHGLAALGDGHYQDAYEHLIRTFRPEDPAWHYSARLFMIGDLAEAALHAGRQEEARTLLAETEAAINEMASPDGLVAVKHARAMLAGEDEAERLFEQALASVQSRRPFIRARLQLAYGTWLRRERRVVESRAPLRAAREGFDALETAGWAERARRELRASGVESRSRERGVMDELTPQEMQIARMAASGLSNREIGSRLFLSHRTVGTHLYRAFPKLGVTSRGQLRDVLEPTQH